MRRLLILAITLVSVAVYGSLRSNSAADDQAEIRALEDQFAKACRAKDMNAIMSVYVPDESLFVFDVIPPRQYVGAAAYRKDWEGFFSQLTGPITFELSDLDITTDGKLGYGHSIQHLAGTMSDGTKVDLTVRVTDCYRKLNGKWLVAQEHVSVPVDLVSGKADLSSKP